MKKINILDGKLSVNTQSGFLRIIKIYIIISIALILCCCSGYTITGGPASDAKNIPNLVAISNDKRLVSINSLLILPVDYASGVEQQVPSSVNTNAMLSGALQDELQIKLVHAVKSDFTIRPLNEYVADARNMHLDGILYTKINNFNVRQGSRLGSEDPARVDLTMQIISAGDNKLVWQSNYHFKDQAISDNLFKLDERLRENKAQFLSADEILARAFKSSIMDFSQKRLGGFVR